MTDHVLRRDSYSLIEIRPDGRFDVEVEVEAPQALYMQIGEDVSGYVFVAPGDTLMCYYSITDLQNPGDMDMNRYGIVPGSWEVRRRITSFI